MSEQGLEGIDAALATGDLRRVRKAIAALERPEREFLHAKLGERDYEELLESAADRRATRGKQGKVVVLHGVTGSMLDVARGTDADRVWVNPLRHILSRISDLLSDALEGPDGVVVRTPGLHARTNLPLIRHLGTSWDVLPFA